MLTSMKIILDHAHKHHYAVMAMNSINMEMVRGAITAAQEAYSPHDYPVWVRTDEKSCTCG